MAIPVASMIGMAAAATRRVWARALSIATSPASPDTARSGCSTAVITLVMPGPSSANPMATTITVGPAVLAAAGPLITVIVTIASATPPARNTSASSSRPRLSQRRGMPASASASLGCVRAARRPATSAATSAVSRATPAAATAGTQPWRNATAGGTRPLAPSWSNSQWPR
ncbi:MAG TPA: hypothetical protein VFA46_22300 [Actinomycetes bacterium]|nr:hypothetical protein [Actinomycetes bacterium]